MRILLNTLVVLALGSCGSQLAWSQSGHEEEVAHYAEVGQKALVAGQYLEACADFEQLAKLSPNTAEVHATLAAIYFKLRKYESAVREARTALKLKPTLPKIDSMLGLSLSEMGQFVEALPHLEKGFRQGSDSEVKRMCGLQLLRAYTNLNRNGEAVETAVMLNKLYPDDAEVLYHTGRIYGNQAYIVMTKLRDKAPNSIWMLQASAEANESQEKYDAAIAAYTHVLELEPKRPGIHYRLGRIYQARFTKDQKPEDRDAAQREFNAELNIDPNNGNARYELATIQNDLGNLNEAQKLFEQVLQLFPDFQEALVGLGGVLLDSQKPEAAVAPLERAIHLNPDDAVAWYRLARAYRATGKIEENRKALAEFRRLHTISPGDLRKPNADDAVTPQKLGSDVQQ